MEVNQRILSCTIQTQRLHIFHYDYTHLVNSSMRYVPAIKWGIRLLVCPFFPLKGYCVYCDYYNTMLTNTYIALVIVKYILKFIPFTSYNNVGIFVIIQIMHLRLKDILWFYFDTTQFENISLTSSFIPFRLGQSRF